MLKIKNKGFTLIELLAVIVILAVVALVATPIIIASVNNAKMSAANSSALGYIDAVNNYASLNDIEPENYPYILEDGVYDIAGTDISKTYLNDIIKVTGNKPEQGWIYIQNKRVVQYSFKIDGYIVSQIETTIIGENEGEINNVNNTVVKATGDNSNPVNKPEEVETNILRITKLTSESAPTGFSGVLKVVYLDPTDLTKSCTKEEAESNVFEVNNTLTSTGKNSGCMKWYAYKEENGFYKMILDHNTTPRIIFTSTITASTASTELMMNEINARLREDTKDWDLSIDQSTYSTKIKEVSIITGEEVKTITGKTSVNLSKENWFYFEGTGTKFQKKPDKYASGSTSAYEWLYDYTNMCKTNDFGCSIEDNNTYKGQKLNSENKFEEAGELENFYGYWTNTITNNSTYVLYISRDGHISIYLPVANNFGIRPVITVSASLID